MLFLLSMFSIWDPPPHPIWYILADFKTKWGLETQAYTVRPYCIRVLGSLCSA